MALQSVYVKREAPSNYTPNHSSNDKFFGNKIDKQQFNKNVKCVACEEQHSLGKCPSFLKKNSHDRFNLAKAKMLYMNGLSATHKTHDVKVISRADIAKNIIILFYILNPKNQKIEL